MNLAFSLNKTHAKTFILNKKPICTLYIISFPISFYCVNKVLIRPGFQTPIFKAVKFYLGEWCQTVFILPFTRQIFKCRNYKYWVIAQALSGVIVINTAKVFLTTCVRLVYSIEISLSELADLYFCAPPLLAFVYCIKQTLINVTICKR